MTDNSHSPEQKNQPLVSVMMPAYNTEKYVGEAIESIIHQTYTNWELICVDDGSTDRTLEIVQEYAANDPRIRVFANEENRGRPYTRNRIIELARGEILAVQDADDISLPHRLTEGVDILAASPDITVVGSGVIEIDEDGDETGRAARPALLNSSLEETLVDGGMPVGHPTALIRTEAVRAVGGYDEFFALAQDYDLFLRLAQRYSFTAVGKPWYKYRRYAQQGSISRRGEQKLYAALSYRRAQAAEKGVPFNLESEFDQSKTQLSKSGSLRKHEAKSLYSLGIDHIGRDKVSQARGCFGDALRCYPIMRGAWFGYVLTFLPERIRNVLLPRHWRCL